MNRVTEITAAPLLNGVLKIWVVNIGDTSGEIWSCQKQSSDPDSKWTKWCFWKNVRMDSHITAAPLSDGRLQFWTVADNKIFTCWTQSTDPDSEWTEWTEFCIPPGGVDSSGCITAAPLSDGRLQLWIISKTTPRLQTCKTYIDKSYSWTEWSDFIPVLNNWSPLAVTPLSNGGLQLWASMDNEIISCWTQSTDPDSEWTEWSYF